MNDLWCYSPTTNRWAWLKGSDGSDLSANHGVYGTQGKPDNANNPGGRCISVSWTGPNDKLYLFGGFGLAESDNPFVYEALNDLWVYNENTYTVTFQTDGTPGAAFSGASTQIITFGGNAAPVTADAPSGYHFAKWKKEAATYSLDNPLTVSNITDNLILTACFAVDANYTLTYAAGSGGAVNGTTPQTLPAGADGSAVTAIPGIGYHFVDWSDQRTDNPRIDADVASDINVTANFAINTYTVSFQTDGAPGASISGTLIQAIEHGGSSSPINSEFVSRFHVFQMDKIGSRLFDRQSADSDQRHDGLGTDCRVHLE